LLVYPLLKVQGIYANLMNLSTLFLPEDFTKALLRFYRWLKTTNIRKTFRQKFSGIPIAGIFISFECPDI